MIFLLHVEWPEMPPYKLLLTYYVWRIVRLNWMAYSELPWRPFLGHQAWSWTTLIRGNVFFIIFTNDFYFCHVFYFYLNVFLHLRCAGFIASVSLDMWVPVLQQLVGCGGYHCTAECVPQVTPGRVAWCFELGLVPGHNVVGKVCRKL